MYIDGLFPLSFTQHHSKDHCFTVLWNLLFTHLAREVAPPVPLIFGARTRESMAVRKPLALVLALLGISWAVNASQHSNGEFKQLGEVAGDECRVGQEGKKGWPQ